MEASFDVDHVLDALLANGPLGAVCIILLYVIYNLWQDGKTKDAALLAEKDRRITDATTFANSLTTGIQTMRDQTELLEKAFGK